MLLIKGFSRFLLPFSVLWGIVDWLFVSPWMALAYAALAGNYILVYALSWTAPALMNGPWRIRAPQTFILLANAVALPIMFNSARGRLPWGFIAITVLAFAALIASTAIHMHLHERLPADAAFAARKSVKGQPAAAQGSPAGQASASAAADDRAVPS